MKLTDFLLARIDEDEAAVRDVELSTDRGTITRELSAWDLLVDNHADVLERTGGRALITISADRVRAEIRARRRVVALHGDDVVICEGGYRPGATHREIEESVISWGVPVGPPCATLRALALPYVEHEDYEERWKL